MGDIGKYQTSVTRRTRTMSIRGIEYCVNEWGDEDAPLFFYLHGWADTGSTFQFVVDSLTANWRVIAPDWRGFGCSGHQGSSYWFPDYLADLHCLLDEYTPHAPARLVGHSMGANVCSLYAGVMPERVSAIVNIEGFGLTNSDPDQAPKRYREWLEASQNVQKFSTYPNFGALVTKIRKRSPGIDGARADFVAREWAHEIDGTVHLRADPNHKLPNAVLYRRAEAEACWRKVSAAMLLVSGDHSQFAIPDDDTGGLPFRNSSFCTISGAGHMIHLEAPRRLAEQIEQFLKQPL
jgi:pimeloyl-ACP methyl ester carboxylesterase